MMLGYSAGVPELEGDGGHAEQSSAVQAVVDLYGPCDLTDQGAGPPHHQAVLWGASPTRKPPEAYNLASPIKHLDKSDPPTLIFHVDH